MSVPVSLRAYISGKILCQTWFSQITCHFSWHLNWWQQRNVVKYCNTKYGMPLLPCYLFVGSQGHISMTTTRSPWQPITRLVPFGKFHNRPKKRWRSVCTEVRKECSSCAEIIIITQYTLYFTWTSASFTNTLSQHFLTFCKETVL